MNKRRKLIPLLSALIVVASLLTSCAQYSVRTNKMPGISEKISSVYVWSGIGRADPFTSKLLFANDTFEDLFNAAFAKKLTELGIANEIRKYYQETDRQEDLARFEGNLRPSYRLFVEVSKLTTITSRGITSVDVLFLDIGLFRIRDNNRIWRGEVVVNCNTVPGTAWREEGANKLASQITDALRRDGFI